MKDPLNILKRAPLFPLYPKKDGPIKGKWRAPRGWRDFTADGNDKRLNSGTYPACAMCCGNPLSLIDVDPRNGGDVSLKQMAKAGQIPRPVIVVATPGGGWHIYVRTTGLRSCTPLDGIDILAKGKLAVVPPTPGYRVLSHKEWPDLGAYPDDADDRLRALLNSPEKDETTTPGEVMPRPAGEDVHPYAARAIAGELARLEACDSLGWGGPPWDSTTYDVACNLIEFANSGWSGYSLDDAKDDLMRCAPMDPGFGEKEHESKWRSAMEKVGGGGRDDPNASGFTAAGPANLDDAHLSAWMAHNGLYDNWCWTRGLGWLHWDSKKWANTSDVAAQEAVRVAVIELFGVEALANVPQERLKALRLLLSRGRIGGIVGLMKGVVEVEDDVFDKKPELLNVGNGVVHLPTGELRPHDRSLMLTKITNVKYHPGKEHKDWDKVLGALPPEVRDWVQYRFGQGLTGYPVPDDILPILLGGGSNGKTTLMKGILSAAGEHGTPVSDRILTARPEDHPTELTTLRGARIAVMEEMPEGRYLNIKRLKDTVGGTSITARKVHKDDMTWEPTHSLFMTTNYAPPIAESDWGTWRRVALVRFPFTFKPDARDADTGLRSRIIAGRNGQHEAALAWMVEGARRYYENEAIPPAPKTVLKDTNDWRVTADTILSFIQEFLEYDLNSEVLNTELFTAFNQYLFHKGKVDWGEKLFASRFGGHSEIEEHDVRRVRVRTTERVSLRWPTTAVSDRPYVWRGLRWKGE